MHHTSLDRVLSAVARVGVFIVPFIPLIVASPLFFPFITGKGFTFRIIVEVIFAVWLLLALRSPHFRPKGSLLLWSVLAFVGVVFVADIFAVSPFKAFWSNFERMEGFITLAHLLLYFLVTTSVLNEEKWWHRFFATSIGVSVFLSIYGLLQLAGKIVINQGGVRLDGTFGNAAYFAGYMLFHVFLVLFLLSRTYAFDKRKEQRLFIPSLLASVVSFVLFLAVWIFSENTVDGGTRVFFSLLTLAAPLGAYLFWRGTDGVVTLLLCTAGLLQMFSLYHTATRGAGIGLIIGLFLSLLLIAVLPHKDRLLRYLAMGSCIALLLFVGAVYKAKDTEFVKNTEALTRFASISTKDAAPRFMVWGMAWEGFQERPLLGWGQEGFNYVFNKYYNPNMWSQEQWFDRTHNIFLDWLISAGALGLFTYLSLFAFLLWYLWFGKPNDSGVAFSFAEKSFFTGLLASYFVHNFFVFDNLISYILFFSVIAFIHTHYSKPIPTLEKLPHLSHDQGLSIAGGFITVGLIFCIYFLNGRPIEVASALISGLRPQEKGITENLRNYKEAFARETIGSQEVAEQAIQASLTVAAAPSIPEPIKAEFVSFALQAMNREIERAPEDARLRMFIGGSFNRLGRYQEALPHLEKGHASSPTKQTLSFELSNTYLSVGRQKEAAAMLREQYENAPEFILARIAYAVALVYAGDYKLADMLMASEIPAGQSDEQLVKAYYQMKQYPKVISLLKLRLVLRPDDPQTHVSLAAAYVSNGNRNEAIAELQKAIDLNPEFKKQGEFYINEIKAGRNP